MLLPIMDFTTMQPMSISAKTNSTATAHSVLLDATVFCGYCWKHKTGRFHATGNPSSRRMCDDCWRRRKLRYRETRRSTGVLR
ncbi:MAG: hypothetical protein ABIP64_04880 [Burkholderiales bacterium]